MGKVGGQRNFGYGRNMVYAAQEALKDRFRGHYRTVSAHTTRFGNFYEWAKQHGVKDAQHITPELLKDYGSKIGQQVKGGTMSVSYGKNLLSSANVALSAMRGDDKVRIEPAAFVGERSQVRTEAPSAMDRAAVHQATVELRASGHDRAAALIEAARDLGLRLKEAALMNYREAFKEALEHGRVNVTEGTKGGRGHCVDRYVPVSDQALRTLERAAQAQGDGRNLVPPDQSWYQFKAHIHNVALPALEHAGLTNIRDLRASYACDRYRYLTGHDAPCISGSREASHDNDAAARKVIAEELGHGRTSVCVSYVGSAR